MRHMYSIVGHHLIHSTIDIMVAVIVVTALLILQE